MLQEQQEAWPGPLKQAPHLARETAPLQSPFKVAAVFAACDRDGFPAKRRRPLAMESRGSGWQDRWMANWTTLAENWSETYP